MNTGYLDGIRCFALWGWFDGYGITLLSSSTARHGHRRRVLPPLGITLLSNWFGASDCRFWGFTTIRNYTTLKHKIGGNSTMKSFTTIRNYTTFKPRGNARRYCASFTTIRNYTTLKPKLRSSLSGSCFTTIRNYTTLKPQTSNL